MSVGSVIFRQGGPLHDGLVATVLNTSLLLSIATTALAQGKALSLVAIEGLLNGGVTTARVVSLVGEKGVSFEMTGDVRTRLERAGADADLIAAIEGAAAARVPRQAPPPAEPQRGAEPAPTEAPARTALVVRTNVSGDDVQIDGRSVGGSGPTPRDVTPGRHTVTVKCEGYRTVEGEVEVREGETKTISLMLKPIEEPASAPPQPAEAGSPGGMVSVSGGSFFMGCNEAADDECLYDEKPGKTVDVRAFRIDKTEVTVADYRRCIEAGRCGAPDEGGSCNWGQAGRDRHPINCVSWDQAMAFCEWQGKRLPTEAEWEKAARGTDRRKYPWGNAGYGSGGKVANICDANCDDDWKLPGYYDGYADTAPVGNFPAGASPYGALDMVGNVWEWTSDWYPDRIGEARVVRGGSWYNGSRLARASHRLVGVPGLPVPYFGFRCAR